MTDISLVPVNDIDRIWPEVAEQIEKAGKYGVNVTPAWLFTMCRNGNAMLFRIGTDAAFVGQFIDDWPGGPVLKILALGGSNMKAWRRVLKHWQWPRQFGVTRFAFGTPRPGLAEVFGARLLYSVYEVDLTDA